MNCKIFHAWDSMIPERKAELQERAESGAAPSFIEDYVFDEDDYFDGE